MIIQRSWGLLCRATSALVYVFLAGDSDEPLETPAVDRVAAITSDLVVYHYGCLKSDLRIITSYEPVSCPVCITIISLTLVINNYYQFIIK